MKKTLGILLALALVLSFSIVATTPVGADPGPVVNTDTGKDFSSIQAAIDDGDTLAGHTITVAAGTYDLTSSIRVTKAVSIIGDIDNPQNVVINAGTIPLDSGPKPPDRDKDGFQVAADGVTIKGFKIINAISVLEGSGDGWQNAGITVGGDITLIDWLDPYNEPILIDGGTFSNNIIEDCTFGIYLAMARNVIVSDNTIRNITTDRPGMDGAGIMAWSTKHWGEGNYQDPTGNIIEGNLIEDCERQAICLGAWEPDHFSVSGTIIRNNTIRNCGAWGIELMYIEGPMAIIGNEIYSNYRGIGVGPEVSGVEAHFNNIHNNTVSGAHVWDSTETASLDARYNWWGHASGPSGEGPGSGDSVIANVDFEPWLGAKMTDQAAGCTADRDTGSTASPSTDNVSAQATGGDTDTTVTVAEYVGNPSGVSPGLRAGTFFFDVHVGGTEPDTLVVAANCPGGDCSGTVLRWFDGSQWQNVTPVSYTNGTVVATLSATSSPTIAELTGTPFGLGGPLAPAALPAHIVGWETYPLNKPAVLAPWIALLAAIMAGTGLLVWRRRRAMR